MNTPTPLNGQSGQQLSLGPQDKFVLVMVDPVGQAIQTMAPNIEDPLEVATILSASLGSVLQKALELKTQNKPRIVSLAPGTRLKQ